VVFCVCGIHFWVGTCHSHIVGTSECPYNDFFTKGFTCGFSQPPADVILAKGKPTLRSDTIWYERECVALDIGEIGQLRVCLLLFMPPVGYIRYRHCTATPHLVRVAINDMWKDLSPVLWCFRRQIQIEPGGGS